MNYSPTQFVDWLIYDTERHSTLFAHPALGRSFEESIGHLEVFLLSKVEHSRCCELPHLLSLFKQADLTKPFYSSNFAQKNWKLADDLSISIRKLAKSGQLFVLEPKINNYLVAKSVIQFTLALLHVVCDFWSDYPIEEMDVYHALSTGFNWPQENMIAYMKYITAAPMATYLKPSASPDITTKHKEQKERKLSELSEFSLARPKDFTGTKFFFGGTLRRRLKLLIVKKTEKVYRFWYHWLMTKKGGPRIPSEMIIESLADHCKQLQEATEKYSDASTLWTDFFSSPKTLPLSWSDETGEKEVHMKVAKRTRFEELLDDIGEFTDQVINQSGMARLFNRKELLDREFQMTTSACRQSSRKTLGVFGAIRHRDDLQADESMFYIERPTVAVRLEDTLSLPIETRREVPTPRKILEQAAYDLRFGKFSVWARTGNLGVRGSVDNVTTDFLDFDAPSSLPYDDRDSGLPCDYDRWGTPFDFLLIDSHDHGFRIPNFLDRRTEPVAIAEPFKSRVITKGNGTHQYIGKPLQNVMWSSLKAMPVFGLIGERISDRSMDGLLERVVELGFPQELIVSGDYKGATDRLKIEVTKTIANRIFSRIRHSMRDEPNVDLLIESYRRCLFEQSLVYKLPKDEMFYFLQCLFPVESSEWKTFNDAKVPYGSLYSDPSGEIWFFEVEQKQGQLMGSVLSFPILCIANLYGIASVWRDQGRISGFRDLRDLPVRVNGDDIIFFCDSEMYLQWSDRIAELGFVKSVGKNYVHPKFATVNSVPIVRDGDKMVVFEPYNTGLLLGQTKLTGRASTAVLPLMSWHSDVLKGAFNQLRANNWFMHYHKKDLAKYTSDGLLNMFIHPDLGGLGFVVPKGLTVKMTAFQKCLALRKIRDLTGMMPTTEFVLESGLDHNAVFATRKTILGDDLKFFCGDAIPDGWFAWRDLVDGLRSGLIPRVGRFSRVRDVELEKAKSRDLLPMKHDFLYPVNSLLPDCSENSLSVRLRRGQRELRKYVASLGYVDPDREFDFTDNRKVLCVKVSSSPTVAKTAAEWGSIYG